MSEVNEELSLSRVALLREMTISFLLAAVVGAGIGSAIGGGIYWLIVPDCEVSREWLCGLGEALISIGCGAVVGFAAFSAIAVRSLRERVPQSQRRLATLLVVLVFPIVAVVGIGFVSSLSF